MNLPVFALLFVFGIPLIFSSTSSTTSLTPNTYLETDDKQRLLSLFKLTSPFESNDDLLKVYYSLLGTSILSNGNINAIVKEKEKTDICQFIQKFLASGDKLPLDNVYYATSASKLINCQTPSTTKLVTLLTSFLTEEASVAQLHRASLSLLNFGHKLDSVKISKLLQVALKKDESLASIGLAFQLGSKFTGAENLTPLVEKIGDIIVQADEVDGRYLQFEGGLGITANIIYGVYTLATVANKPTGLTNDQALKFTNYFLNRKTVQTVKSAAELLLVLQLLVDNKYHIPVCVTSYRSTAVSRANPVITVKVTNVFGKSLGSNTKVTIESPVTSGKKALSPVTGDGTLFAVEIDKQAKRGTYSLSVSVTKGEDKRYIGNTNAELQVNIMTKVKLDNVEFTILDSDQSSSGKSVSLVYPKKIDNELEADHHQKLLFKFTLKDESNSEIMAAHQTFILFTNVVSKQEIVFVAEPENGKVNTQSSYKFDLNLNSRGKDFAFKSGAYDVSLIIGDAIISNSINWKFGSIKLTFSSPATETQTSTAPWMTADYQPKPEIKHLFREPEVRPSAVISNAFSILVCVPFVILLVLWIKIGVNFRNVPLCLSFPVFHIGLGSIFGLFAYFWLQLDMFTTLKYLLALGLITFLSGHSLLTRLAKKD